MRIGLLSDTHAWLDPAIFTYLKDCDEIWHAGDIGNLQVLQELEAFKPTVAVYGNVDDHKVREALPEDQIFSREGMRFLMTHIAGVPPRYNTRVRQLLLRVKPQVLICGHSHILKVQQDREARLLYMNPGAAGKHGFHKVKTLLRFSIQQGKLQQMEVVELGPRGNLT